MIGNGKSHNLQSLELVKKLKSRVFVAIEFEAFVCVVF